MKYPFIEVNIHFISFYFFFCCYWGTAAAMPTLWACIFQRVKEGNLDNKLPGP